MRGEQRKASVRWFDRFKRVYLIFFVSYLFMLLLPLGGIMYLYAQVMGIAEKNSAKNAMEQITEVSAKLQAQFSWMDSKAAQFLLDSQVTSMIYAEPLTYGDKRINSFMAFGEHLDDLIGTYDKNYLGYRMLFQDNELVFYEDAMSHGLAFVFEHTLNYQGMTYEEWYEAVFGANGRTLLPVHDISLGNMKIRALTYNYPILRRTAEGSGRAVLQFFIRESDLYPAGFNTLSTGYLIGQDGGVLSSFGAQEPFPQEMAGQLKGSGWQRLADGLLVAVDVRDGMQLAMLIPAAVAFHDVIAMRWPMLAVFSLCAVLEGLLILFLAKRNARPIETLASDMTQVLDTPRQGNELEYIQQGIVQLQQNHQTEMQKNLRNETALLLNRLLNQRTDDVEVLLRRGEKIGIDLRAESYCVAVAQLPEGAQPVPGAKVPELPEHVRAVIGEGRRNRLNVLYLVERGAEAEQKECIAAHLSLLYEQLPRGTRIGQGRICGTLEDVTFSFNQAMYCLQTEQPAAGITAFDQVSPGVNSLYFPLEQQQRIVNAVKYNHAEIIDQEFALILRENTVSRHLSSLMKRTLLSSIEALLLMAAEDVSRQENLSDYLRAIHHSDDFRASLEVLRLEFRRIAEQVGGRYAQVNNQRAAMEAYVEAHYSDSMLSIGQMAEEFGFSESYFSVLFKDVLGEPYSAYLEKVRLNKAGELLRSTEISVEEVAQMSGYNNSTTFRRAFKRVKGLSPQQYRNQEPST